ncbi:hypothetical protein OAL67_00290 [bacterium]|nr:hypothetical protein [bacterium]
MPKPKVIFYKISLLLFIFPAFYINFFWDTFHGLVRFGLLTLAATVFTTAGLIIHRVKNLQNLGDATTLMGAVTIPAVGYTLYKHLGMNFDFVWLYTSLTLVLTYFGLLIITQNSIYKYLILLAGVSLGAATLGGFGIFIVCYLYLFLDRILTKTRVTPENSPPLFRQGTPWLAALFLVLGLLIHPNSILIPLFGLIFFGTVYHLQNKKYAIFLATALALSLIGNVTYANIPISQTRYYVMFFMGLYLSVAAYVFHRINDKHISKDIIESTTVVLALNLVYTVHLCTKIYCNISLADTIILAGMLSLIGLLGYLMHKSTVTAAIGQGALIYISSHLFLNALPAMSLPSSLLCLSLVMLLFSFLNFVLVPQLATGLSHFWAITAFIVASGHQSVAAVIGLSLGLYYLYRQRRDKEVLLSLIPPLLITYSFSTFLATINTPSTIVPVFYGMFACAIVLPLVLLTKKKDVFAHSFANIILGISGLVISMVYALALSRGPGLSDTPVILGMYLYSTLLTIVGLKKKSTLVKHVSIAFWVLTYALQLKIVGIFNSTFYLLPIGLILLYISQKERKKRKNRFEYNWVVELLAVLTILVATITKIMGPAGFQYALITGFEGVLLINWGLKTKSQNMIGYGTGFILLAALSQVYLYSVPLLI